MKAGRGRLLALTGGIALALLATEILLQILAFSATRWRVAETGLEAGAPVVLCVGDSFTYGMGATKPDLAYPERLEAELRQVLPRPVEVVNGGWAGQTSRDVLLRLPAQLARFRPRVVCILCGINDFGTATPRVTPAELTAASSQPDQSAFVWQARLPRLLLAAARWITQGGPAYSQHGTLSASSVVGSWHDSGYEVKFEADGRLLVHARSGSWRIEGDRLRLRLPDLGDFDAQARLTAGQLELCLPGRPALSLQRGAPPQPAGLLAAEQQLTAGQLEQALASYLALEHDYPALATARVVQCLSALGRDQEARARATRLQERVAAGQINLTTTAIEAWVAAGEASRALELVAQADPALDQEILATLLELSQQPQQYAAIIAATSDLLRERQLPPRLRARLLRVLHLAHSAREPRTALRALLEAELLDPASAYSVMRIQQPVFTEALLASVLDELQLDAAQRQHLLELRAGGSTQDAQAVLTDHLQRMIGLIERAGATALLITYPFAAPVHDGAQRRAAGATGTAVVDLVAPFDRLLTTCRWEDLFVVDGHCNDRGYHEVARCVAPAVAQRVD